MSYLYDYVVYEIVDREEILIAEYQSNTSPPPKGSILDLSEFVTTKYGVIFRGEIVLVTFSPRVSERNTDLSDQTHVTVHVVSATKRTDGEIVHAKAKA